MSVLIISIVVIIVAFAVLMVGAFFGISYLTRRKQAADLDRYLKGENCQWERIPTPGEAATDTEGDLLYKNTAPESSGIEMRDVLLPPARRRRGRRRLPVDHRPKAYQRNDPQRL